MHIHPPGRKLLLFVRARFTERGISLHHWCKTNGVDWGDASRALTGVNKFPAAMRLRDRIIKESKPEEAL